MAKRLIPFFVILLIVSCSRNEESNAPVEKSEEQPHATASSLPDEVISDSPTISLVPKGAHEPWPSGPTPPERTASTPIREWARVEHLPNRIALFDSVFWDARDTVSLRELIANTDFVKGKSVLEIGTGSGLLSLYCLKYGAASVIATDVNQLAVENARYNAKQMGFEDRFEVRLVPLDDAGAYSVIETSERFDLIISNPPWEDAKPERIDDYAYYDPGFALLQSLLTGLPDHLNPEGKALLAYGAVEGIRILQQSSSKHGFHVEILDDRDLEKLPPVFVPGMLLEVSP